MIPVPGAEQVLRTLTGFKEYATGTLLVGPLGYLLLSAGVLALSFIGLRVGVRLFDREAILTRWR